MTGFSSSTVILAGSSLINFHTANGFNSMEELVLITLELWIRIDLTSSEYTAPAIRSYPQILISSISKAFL